MNSLYYGDNLDVLRRHIPDMSVDLVYLDPPFNSNASYNVLFAERDGTQAASQIKAFEDTWHWDDIAARAFHDVVEGQHQRLSQVMQAFRTFLGESDMLAYLAMMAPRLAELRRVLKPSGNLYLHCDPTASHYLKMLLDAVFGPERFRNEIIWKRTSAHSSAKRYGPVHDVILFYARSDDSKWYPQHLPHSPEYLASHYRNKTPEGRAFTLSDLTASGVRHGSSGQSWRGFDPASKGNHWKFTIESLERLDDIGRIYWPEKQGGWPRYIRYLDEVKGTPLQDVWTDIDPVNAKAAERLHYPTQKPLALMERILATSSLEGDVVLDPFCGCGTTIAAAQKMNRRWIGIDITHLAISLIRHRLTDSYGSNITSTYRVVGEPVSIEDAEVLASSEPYQFQAWALGLVGARLVGDVKKGADRGIDGRIYFHEGDGQTRQIVLQVKAGKLHAPHVRDLRGVVEREKASIGVLLTLEEPTKSMRVEAASAGFYRSHWGHHPRLQLLTVGDLLGGKRLDAPPFRQTSTTFKRAPQITAESATQLRLDDSE